MTTTNKIIEIAQSEVGYTEQATNKTKFGEWFGLNYVAWCGIFVSYCYDKAGKPLGNIGYSKGFAGCQTAVAYFTKNKKITTTPVAGDIVFFDWNGDKKFDHTGIFVRDLGNGFFETIEGNTSLANQSNGGSVMLRQRSYKVAIFVHV